MKTVKTDVMTYNPDKRVFSVEASMIRVLDVPIIRVKSHVTGKIEKFYRVLREFNDDDELEWVEYLNYNEHETFENHALNLIIFND